MDDIEIGHDWLDAISGLGTHACPRFRMLADQLRRTPRLTGGAYKLLPTTYLIIAILLFLNLADVIWITLHPTANNGTAGGLHPMRDDFVAQPGARDARLPSLGSNFNVSNSFRAR
jgi:hypothetical protein